MARRTWKNFSSLLFHPTPHEGDRHILEVEVFPTGSRVRVTSHSPFRGLGGTIRAVHRIAADLDEPFCFYLVALEGTYIKELLWFEYNEVELVDRLSRPSR